MPLIPVIDTVRTLPSSALIVLLCVFGAFLFLGWTLAPAIARRVEESTSGYVKWMIETLDKMFLTVSGRTCLYLIIASTVFWFFFGYWFTSGLPSGDGYFAFRTLISLILCLGLFGLPTGYRMPRAIVNRMWDKRIEKFGEQLIDALTFMSNGLRSGLSLIQSMDMVKEELYDPMSQEFALILSQQRLGVPLEDALLSLEKRMTRRMSRSWSPPSTSSASRAVTSRRPSTPSLTPFESEEEGGGQDQVDDGSGSLPRVHHCLHALCACRRPLHDGSRADPALVDDLDWTGHDSLHAPAPDLGCPHDPQDRSN